MTSPAGSTDPTDGNGDETAGRAAATLAPGEEWACGWERCYCCPRALKTVPENVAGVCTTCQAAGRAFPRHPAVPPAQHMAQARAILEYLIREGNAIRRERGERGETP